MMFQHLAPLDSRPALGREDIVLLMRLRAIATLLCAGGSVRPELRGMEIGLSIDPVGRLRLFHSITARSILFVARRAGWHDLLEGEQTNRGARTVFDGICERLAPTEIPNGCPPALRHRLMRNDVDGPAAAEAALFARMGWGRHLNTRILRPVLARFTSAHEALEVLVAAEAAGGLGSGPLGRLASEVAARLSSNPP